MLSLKDVRPSLSTAGLKLNFSICSCLAGLAASSLAQRLGCSPTRALQGSWGFILSCCFPFLLMAELKKKHRSKEGIPLSLPALSTEACDVPFKMLEMIFHALIVPKEVRAPRRKTLGHLINLKNHLEN